MLVLTVLRIEVFLTRLAIPGITYPHLITFWSELAETPVKQGDSERERRLLKGGPGP